MIDLDEALRLLQAPLSERMAKHGWTDDMKSSLFSVLSDWRKDFLEDARMAKSVLGIEASLVRWFLDWPVRFPKVETLIGDLDSTASEALDGT